MAQSRELPPWLKRTRKRSTKGKNRSRSNYNIYNSSRWRKISKTHRIENPKCEDCGQLHSDYKELVCDHIIPINQNGSIWDTRNHSSLCKHPCHDKKSARDKKTYSGPYDVLPNGRKIPI